MVKVSYGRDQMNTSLEWSLIGHGDSVIIRMKRLRKQQAGWNRGIEYRPLSGFIKKPGRGFFVAMHPQKLPVTGFAGCSKIIPTGIQKKEL